MFGLFIAVNVDPPSEKNRYMTEKCRNFFSSAPRRVCLVHVVKNGSEGTNAKITGVNRRVQTTRKIIKNKEML